MKRTLTSLLALLLATAPLMAGCESKAIDADGVGQSFSASIIEMNGDYVLASPLEGDPARSSSDQINFSKSGLPDIGAAVGDTVSVAYEGGIRETYPAQVTATGWTLLEKKPADPDPTSGDDNLEPAAPGKVEYRKEDLYMGISLPEGWSYTTGQEGGTGNETFGITFYPDADPDAQYRLEYHTNPIGICGTGVTFTETTFQSGLTATACTELLGDDTYWYFLIYHEPYERHTLTFCAPKTLWDQYEHTIHEILETVDFGGGL